MKRIFVNGSFDVLHVGHVELLNFAKKLGTHLTVAIDSDERIKKLKGNSRPVNNVFERKTLLENLKAVDSVKVFNTDQELVDIIKTCDIMVKGSDYKNQPIIGSDYINIVFFDRIEEYSTTKKIESIKDSK
jgi:D-beta-D-heptose 7-phosphate kinase/D-beta-D-heptose 1-phosphate adenosyltransferase